MVYYNSVNHSTTTLQDRENIFQQLKPPAQEAVVALQTCNRIEYYGGEGDIEPATVKHLFRVVAGLESGIPGESAIQGQVKAAYEKARKRYSLSSSLHRLFQHALRVGKLVRNSSEIGKGAVSYGQATVEILLASGIDLTDTRITLIGVNKLTEDTIRFLQKKGAETLFVANRSYHKALPYAQKYSCRIVGFDQLQDVLLHTDVLISATSAPYPVILPSKFPENKPMHIFDLAFPRDVDERISHYQDVTLYNLEDIETHINCNLHQRTRALKQAEEIIDLEVQRFYTLINKWKQSI